MTPSPLDADRIRRALENSRFARCIYIVETTGSTNDAVLELCKDKWVAAVLFAEQQTAARGQRGNSWESAPRKGLWFSMLLQPQIPLIESANLTNWAAQAIRETIGNRFALVPHIKPPNDVVISDRKVAGVLVEMRARGKAPYVAVVGIGLNVNQGRADFPSAIRERATSLALELGNPIDRTDLAIALLRVLDGTYNW